MSSLLHSPDTAVCDRLSVSSPLRAAAEGVLSDHVHCAVNPPRSFLIDSALRHREALLTKTGALAVWNPRGETGRIPKDTYIVRHGATVSRADWSSPTCVPMEPDTFDRLWDDALGTLASKPRMFCMDRSMGADPEHALRVRVITDRAVTALFAETMLRERVPLPGFCGEPFLLLVLPTDKLDVQRYEGVLRTEEGRTVDMCIAMDFERRLGLVYGTRYNGAVKKTLFTVMNDLLPSQGILPLHCSANAGADGSTALFLGLSGTGKTTLSTDPHRPLIGDDEHFWTDAGIANMEGGCYAKLVRLRKEEEPGIFSAVFGERPVSANGVIIENAMVYPDGSVDVDDERLTENARAAYPLDFLPNTVPSARGGHPRTIVFLTADAHGVLPPVARLDAASAQLWFLMGYTSKLAGTETGITTPVSAFSRFFGGPFMPRHPADYLALFRAKLERHRPDVYLVNTGWSGGPYGVGRRFPMSVSRAVVAAALSGALRHVPVRRETRWKVDVPVSCPGVPVEILSPRGLWEDPAAYDARADALAAEFGAFFRKTFAGKGMDAAVEAACPGG